MKLSGGINPDDKFAENSSLRCNPDSRAGALKLLSDSKLLLELESLRGRERETTLNILLHLNEVERRRLYLPRGYSSLYDYCTRKLGYSPSAAMRRIKSARCIARYPEVYRILEKGELNLCSVARISTVINPGNKIELLSRVRGKSYREIEDILASYNPKRFTRESVKPVFVMKKTDKISGDSSTGRSPHKDKPATSASVTAGDHSDGNSGKSSTTNVGGREFTTGNASSTDMILTEIKNGAKGESFQLKKKYRLSFTVDSETMEKIKLAISLLSNRFPTGIKYEELFVILLNEYLDRNNPEAKNSRRKEKKQSNKSHTQKRPGQKKPAHSNNSSKEPTRSIPRKVRDEVFTRDGGRCTFVGDDGVRCSCRHNLQIDHIVPFARGGSNSPDNLRLLCARHNLLEAERVFGRDHMEKYCRDGGGQSQDMSKVEEPPGMYYYN